MIDSVYPHTLLPDGKARIVPFKLEFSSEIKPEIKSMVERSMNQTRELLKNWEPPKWEAQLPTLDRNETKNDFNIDNSDSPKTSKHKVSPPLAVLLRARRRVELKDEEPGTMCAVDVFRHRRLLGWENYSASHEFIRTVFDIQGTHYTIFNENNVGKSFESLMKILLTNSRSNL